MTREDVDSQLRAARIAGAAYVLIIASSILSIVAGPFRLVVQGDTAATFHSISANELLFRGGAAHDLVMYAMVVVLSVALFVVLKPVNRSLAMLGMLWRLAEAALGCLTVLGSLAVLRFLGDRDYLEGFAPQQRQAFVGLLLDLKADALSIVFVFLSLGSIVFCCLFFRSRYIPRALALFGILAFSLTLAGALAGILVPNGALMVLGAPAILFEMTVGLWLWIKGVEVGKGGNS